MKIEYKNVGRESHRYNRYLFEYKLVNSILKTHYKELMKISRLTGANGYNTGYITEKDKDKFIALVEKIENSDDKKCATSHQKSIEKKKKNRVVKSHEKCDHADLGSRGYVHGTWVKCPICGEMCEVW